MFLWHSPSPFHKREILFSTKGWEGLSPSWPCTEKGAVPLVPWRQAPHSGESGIVENPLIPSPFPPAPAQVQVSWMSTRCSEKPLGRTRNTWPRGPLLEVCHLLPLHLPALVLGTFFSCGQSDPAGKLWLFVGSWKHSFVSTGRLGFNGEWFLRLLSSLSQIAAQTFHQWWVGSTSWYFSDPSAATYWLRDSGQVT